MLAQCAEFLSVLPIACYTAPSKVLPGGTVGKHVRHLLDHYSASLTGLATDRVVDYDHRERNVPMERDIHAALGSIQEIRTELAALSGQRSELPLTIRIMLTASGETIELATSLGRELAFATHHAVHHQAMMGAIAAEHEVLVADTFGKAPSTLQNLHSGVSGIAGKRSS